MLHSRIGAHRASPTRRARVAVGLALTATVLGSLAMAPSVGAATVAPSATGAVALTTTAVDRPWYSVERFYLGLLNCSRTGGWVLSDGTCRGYGSGHYSKYVAPITYLFGLSDGVSRPYARLLAGKAICSHYANGDPGSRLRASGYARWNWGENVGCRDGYSTAKAAVLASHLVFQSEKSANGGHWKNMKNPKYHWAGIGIWRSSSRTRLVIDFYG